MIASPPQSRWASVRAAHGGGDRDVAAVARRLQSLGDAAHAAMRHVQQEQNTGVHGHTFVATSPAGWLLMISAGTRTRGLAVK